MILSFFRCQVTVWAHVIFFIDFKLFKILSWEELNPKLITKLYSDCCVHY